MVRVVVQESDITPALTEACENVQLVKIVVGYNGRLRPSDNLANPGEMNASVQRFVIQLADGFVSKILSARTNEVEHVCTMALVRSSQTPQSLDEHDQLIPLHHWGEGLQV